MTVVWSQGAQRDLARIHRYRNLPYRTAETQKALVERIIRVGNALDREALLHERKPDGTREKLIDARPYVVVYEVPDEQEPNTVHILSIWHTRRDRWTSVRR